MPHLRLRKGLRMQTTQDTPSTDGYGLIVGGYRVTFTNWNGNGRETFFQNKEDAQNYLAKFKAYGYKGEVETIHFNVKEGN
jgi:hypothetical protein